MMPSLAHDVMYIILDDFSSTWDTPTYYDFLLSYSPYEFIPAQIPAIHFRCWSGSLQAPVERTPVNVVLGSHWDTNGYKNYVAVRCTPWGLPGTWHRITYDGLEPLFVDQYGFPVPAFDRIMSN
jgi:hypothetical protein